MSLSFHTSDILYLWHLIRKIRKFNPTNRTISVSLIIKDIGFSCGLLFADKDYDEDARKRVHYHYMRLFDLCVDLMN